MGIVADNLRVRKSTYHSYHPNSGSSLMVRMLNIC